MKKIILLFFVIGTFLQSQDYIVFKNNYDKTQIDTIWIKNTRWIKNTDLNNNRQILRILKKKNEDYITKNISFLNSKKEKAQQLSDMLLTYDILLYDLANSTIDRKILKQEIKLCSMFLNNFVNIEFFLKNIAETNILFKDKYNEIKNTKFILKHSKDIELVFSLMNKIQEYTKFNDHMKVKDYN